LYRATHLTFEAYCLDRFGYNRRHPYLLIEAAKVVDNIESQCDPLDRILPTNERQVRPLTKLNKKQQVVAWKKAVVEAGDRVPSGRIVRNVVRQLQAATIPNLYQVGEVCQIVLKIIPN
jgi:SRSO17 transposase